jgi:hypothetical protein
LARRRVFLWRSIQQLSWMVLYFISLLSRVRPLLQSQPKKTGSILPELLARSHPLLRSVRLGKSFDLQGGSLSGRSHGRIGKTMDNPGHSCCLCPRLCSRHGTDGVACVASVESPGSRIIRRVTQEKGSRPTATACHKPLLTTGPATVRHFSSNCVHYCPFRGRCARAL